MALNVLALIPARSGSKSYPDKNIRPFLGKPLIAHSIEQALATTLIDRVIVSTDSEVYAAIAKKFGAEVPFLRPAETAGDLSTDLEVFRHALQWLADNEGYVPDICTHLRPTYPVRRVSDIDAVVKVLADNSEIDSVRSVAPAPETPFKMWYRSENGLMEPVCTASDIPEAHSAPRQGLPEVFLQNAAIDAVRSSVVTERNSMVGDRVFGYVMGDNYDIDDLAQFAAAEQAGKVLAGGNGKGWKTFCFDIDGVIATIVPGNDYSESGPRAEMIAHINALFDQGHRIILNTARGTMTGIDWSDVTKKQLEAWGLRYHELHFGKPAADYYIDDKMLPLDKVGLFTDNDDTSS